ncbi:MAG: 2-hydroxyacyl-CoA dehydratase [Desulfobacterales bacterium]|nr:2-hydroxyacyl-CoA dehydratase [Desulfobacterales bacterium]
MITKTKSGENLSRILQKAYLDMHMRASKDAFVIWIAINVPAELFLGFDNVVYCVPESHAALNAAKGVGSLQCEKAENLGYSMDLCSYARIDIGCVSDGGKDSPTFGLPKPDLLISNTNNCSLLVKWFDVHHRELNVPHFILDIPFCYEPQKKKDLDYISYQFQEMIHLIETMSGQSFNLDKAKQAVLHTNRAIYFFKKFLDLACNKPSGITAFDSFVHMAPALVLRGTKEFEEHVELLAKETESQVNNGIFPVPNEKYRLFWDNIAPWHQLRNMSKRLSELNVNIIGATYTSCIGSVEGSFDFYPYNDNPLTYLARTQNAYICPHGIQLRRQALISAVKRLSVDGVVFSSNRSCKPYSIFQIDQQSYIEHTLGVPSVMIDVDHADNRNYNEETVFLKIEALLERIETIKY